MKSNTRAQISIFIILGILTIITLSVVYYVVTQEQSRPIEETIIVPAEVQPFYDFTRNCVSTIAKQGLIKIGLQGGYASVPFSISRTPDSYVPLDNFGLLRIPYWYYEGEDRTPPLDFIARELTIYIQDNLDACLADFTAFPDLTVVERSALTPQVTIGQDSVLITLDWSVDLEFPDKTVSVPPIVSRQNVKLNAIHDLASSTMRAANERNLFENLTIDLLAIHPDIPFDGMEIACTPTRWPLVQVKQDIQNLLVYNIPQIRVKGTDSPPFLASDDVYEELAREREQLLEALDAGAENPTYPENAPEDAYYYFRMNFDVGAQASDLKAGFSYRPEWGLDLDVNPRDGGILKSNLVQGERQFLSFVCINQYHFVYDLVYPVVMNIRDPTAFNGEGYTFQFALPVIIDNNEAHRELRGHRRFDIQFADLDYCNTLAGPVVDLRAQGFEAGLPFAIELDDVTMNFACGTQQCTLGTTAADDGAYRLRTAMPQGCGNPFITAQKDGYLADQNVLVSTANDSLTLNLIKLKQLNVEVVKHPYFAVDNRLEAEPTALRESETALIYLRTKNVSVPHEQYLDVSGDNLPDTVQLAEENMLYDITVYVSDAFGNIIAGYNADNLAISYDDVASADTLVLHTLAPSAVPNTDQARAETIGLIFGDQFEQTLRPTFR